MFAKEAKIICALPCRIWPPSMSLHMVPSEMISINMVPNARVVLTDFLTRMVFHMAGKLEPTTLSIPSGKKIGINVELCVHWQFVEWKERILMALDPFKRHMMLNLYQKRSYHQQEIRIIGLATRRAPSLLHFKYFWQGWLTICSPSKRATMM